MSQGTVKWFNTEKDFGFISPATGTAEIFVHYSEIAGNGFRSPDEDTRVAFEIGRGERDQQAIGVTAL